MIIYKATNKINGKIYIGQTLHNLNNRIVEHVRGKDKTYFQNALGRYGIQSFDFSIIDIASCKNDLNEKEKYWIRFYNCKSPNGYNLTDGGEGRVGYKPSEETRRKLSAAKKNISDETRKRLSDAATRRIVSQETRKKMSESGKGRIFTEEHKRKIGAANKGNKKLLGHKLTEEHKRHIGEGHKKRTAEKRRNLNETLLAK